MLLAAGITVQIGSQALLNIMVASNAFPNTGISLPFFSAGGTALIFQLVEMGIMMSVSRQTIKHKEPKNTALKAETASAE
jgi:cell division protein FtsW